MKKIFLYSHDGSGNHGCEAIARSTQKILLNKNMTLYSSRPDEDFKYKLNEIFKVRPFEKNDYSKLNLNRIRASLFIRLFKNDKYAERLCYEHVLKENKGEAIGLSIGGDRYCYPGFEKFAYENNILRSENKKTVLWGCSVESSKINNIMKKDLEDYSLIVARESISYNTLKAINKNTVLYPDPAFQLDKIELPLPNGFIENNTVGINISPLISKNETVEGITIENYRNLIKYIIDNTDMQIALIPHVLWNHDDDRIPSKLLYEQFKDTNRVILLGDANCMELKGYISRCRFVITARTHVSVAAYSTYIPTLVIGYSVKARGIAKDIFGTEENYVLPVQSLKKSTDMVEVFKWMQDHEVIIKEHLQNFMPQYCKKAADARLEIEKL